MEYGHVGMEGSKVTSWTARELSRVSTHSCILVVKFSHQSINKFNTTIDQLSLLILSSTRYLPNY